MTSDAPDQQVGSVIATSEWDHVPGSRPEDYISDGHGGSIVANLKPEPPCLWYEDGTGQEREIFIPDGRYQEAVKLRENNDWEALSRFSPWSDHPPIPPRQADVMMYYDGEGTKHEIWIPRGIVDRATELFINEDWEALAREYAPYTDQVRERTKEEIDWEEGMERMRVLREQEAAT